MKLEPITTTTCYYGFHSCLQEPVVPELHNGAEHNQRSNKTLKLGPTPAAPTPTPLIAHPPAPGISQQPPGISPRPAVCVEEPHEPSTPPAQLSEVQQQSPAPQLPATPMDRSVQLPVVQPAAAAPAATSAPVATSVPEPPQITPTTSVAAALAAAPATAATSTQEYPPITDTSSLAPAMAAFVSRRVCPVRSNTVRTSAPEAPPITAIARSPLRNRNASPPPDATTLPAAELPTLELPTWMSQRNTTPDAAGHVVQESSDTRALCRFCGRVEIPMEESVVADRGAAASQEPCGNLSHRCARTCVKCRRFLLVGLRSRGEYTKEAEAEMQGMLQMFLLRHPQAPSQAPITTRYNPDHDKPFHESGTGRIPRSYKSPNTGKFSADADVADALAAAGIPPAPGVKKNNARKDTGEQGKKKPKKAAAEATKGTKAAKKATGKGPGEGQKGKGKGGGGSRPAPNNGGQNSSSPGLASAAAVASNGSNIPALCDTDAAAGSVAAVLAGGRVESPPTPVPGVPAQVVSGALLSDVAVRMLTGVAGTAEGTAPWRASWDGAPVGMCQQLQQKRKHVSQSVARSQSPPATAGVSSDAADASGSKHPRTVGEQGKLGSHAKDTLTPCAAEYACDLRHYMKRNTELRSVRPESQLHEQIQGTATAATPFALAAHAALPEQRAPSPTAVATARECPLQPYTCTPHARVGDGSVGDAEGRTVSDGEADMATRGGECNSSASLPHACGGVAGPSQARSLQRPVVQPEAAAPAVTSAPVATSVPEPPQITPTTSVAAALAATPVPAATPTPEPHVCDSDGPGLATSAAIGGAAPAAVGAQVHAGGSTSPSRVPAAPVAAGGAATSDVEMHGAAHIQHRAGSSSRTGCGPRHGGAAAATAGADAPPDAYDYSDIAMERHKKYIAEVVDIRKEVNDPTTNLSVEDRQQKLKRMQRLMDMADQLSLLA